MLELAFTLRDLLALKQCRLVLVESCTAGGVAATLGLVPGISQWFCGSLVVYRNASKTAWLGVPSNLLDDPQQGPVSAAASAWLATAALERTSEASMAVAITGDMGPHAPPATDGCVFLAAAIRGECHADPSRVSALDSITVRQQQLRLAAPAPRDSTDTAARQARLEAATAAALHFAIAQLTDDAESTLAAR